MKCEPLDPSFFVDKPVAGTGPIRPHFDHSKIPYDEWRALRKGYIGASEVSAILGLNKYSGPFDLAAVKLEAVPPIDPSVAMRMGSFFEPAIRDFFAEELRTGRIEVPGGVDIDAKVSDYPYTLRHDKIPFFCCNLDGVIAPSDGGEVWGVEIKDAGIYSKTDLRYWLEGEKPKGTALMYWVQIQAQLAVSGLSRSMVVIRCEKSLMVGPVYRNEEAIRRMEGGIVNFWNRYLAPGDMPPIDQHAGGVLDQMHPAESEEGTVERLDLAQEVTDLRAELVDIQAKTKVLKANEAVIKNTFKRMVGDNEKLTLGEGVKPLKWKTVNRKDGKNYRKLTI